MLFYVGSGTLVLQYGEDDTQGSDQASLPNGVPSKVKIEYL